MTKILVAIAALMAAGGCASEPEGVFIPFTPTATGIPAELQVAARATAVAEVAATHTSAPTYTPVPTHTPQDTYTPQPLVTPVPTATATKTPLPYHLGVPTPNVPLDNAIKLCWDRVLEGSAPCSSEQVAELAGQEFTDSLIWEIREREGTGYAEALAREHVRRGGSVSDVSHIQCYNGHAADLFPMLISVDIINDGVRDIGVTTNWGAFVRDWTWAQVQNSGDTILFTIICE